MKTIIEKEIGKDGGKVGLSLDGGNIVLQASYPVAGAVEPIAKVVDDALDKLEAMIPGDWDKGPIAEIKKQAREQLVKLLSE